MSYRLYRVATRSPALLLWALLIGSASAGPRPTPGLAVMDTVAIPFQSAWLAGRAAEGGLADRDMLCRTTADHDCETWEHLVLAAREAGPLERLRMINGTVNRRIAYRSDGPDLMKDRWQPAPLTIATASGDCEDLAILKLRLLMEAGVDGADLAIVVVERSLFADRHAVLAVRLEGKLLVLDNLADEIAEDVTLSYYRPLYSLNVEGSWLHGKRLPDLRQVATLIDDSD